MNSQKSGAKDFFLNLGATVSLYTVVMSLIRLLFAVIDKAYPKVTSYYYYGSTPNISWPVAMLVVFTPLLIILMRALEKSYVAEPERKDSGIHRWLAYITLFVSGAIIAGDLVTVLYYFLNGNDMGAAFLLKVLALLVITGCVFGYYLTDIKGQLTGSKRKMWRIISLVIVIGSIILGFAVIGSPRSQRLLRYDELKLSDIQNIDNSVQSFYFQRNILPKNFEELSTLNYYVNTVDSQTNTPYGYSVKGASTYEICAVFNKASEASNSQVRYPGFDWTHGEGRKCYTRTVAPNMVPSKPVSL